MAEADGLQFVPQAVALGHGRLGDRFVQQLVGRITVVVAKPPPGHVDGTLSNPHHPTPYTHQALSDTHQLEGGYTPAARRRRKRFSYSARHGEIFLCTHACTHQPMSP